MKTLLALLSVVFLTISAHALAVPGSEPLCSKGIPCTPLLPDIVSGNEASQGLYNDLQVVGCTDGDKHGIKLTEDNKYTVLVDSKELNTTDCVPVDKTTKITVKLSEPIAAKTMQGTQKSLTELDCKIMQTGILDCKNQQSQ
jgi:hypothetical protein